MALSSPLPPFTIVQPDTYPRVEQAISAPQEWNDAWEHLYTNSPNLVHPYHVMSMTAMFRKRHRVTNKYDDRHGHIVNYETTCSLQHHVGVKTIGNFIHQDFEERWLGASVAERRKHALRSLAHGCSQAWNLNLARAYCSDILVLRQEMRGLPSITMDSQLPDGRRGKIAIGRNLLPDRRMESRVAVIRSPMFLMMPGQAIWEDDPDQLDKEVQMILKAEREARSSGH